MAMKRPYFAYHKTRAPSGKMFDEEVHGPITGLGDGWVDDPAKLGLNVWDDPDAEPLIRQREGQLERGEIDPVDPASGVPQGLRERLQEEQLRNQRLQEQIDRLTAEGHDGLRTDVARDPLAHHQERLADERSDAGIDPGNPAAEPEIPGQHTGPSDLDDIETGAGAPAAGDGAVGNTGEAEPTGVQL